MVCDKVVCERWCVTKLCVKEGVQDGATPATQNEGGCEIVPRMPPATKTSPSAPPSAISATPAMRNEGGCEIVPRLPQLLYVKDGM